MPESVSLPPIPPREEVTLRPASAEDAASIGSLGSRIFTTTFGYSMPPEDLKAYLSQSYSTSAIESDLSNPNITTLVAHPKSSSSTIIGFVQLTEGTTDPCLEGIEDQVELQRLYVDPNFHGGGVGKKLMEAVEDVARQRGFKTMWLGVWEENLKAQGVYKKKGFEKVGSHDFVMGSCVQTDWIMTKQL